MLHYYVAVSTKEAKLATLLELINALRSPSPPNVVICCGSRDGVDAVAAALRPLPHVLLWCLHADLAQRQVQAGLEDFNRNTSIAAIADSDGNAGSSPAHMIEGGAVVKVLMTSDGPLRLPEFRNGVGPAVLCNYEFPASKEICLRRVAAVLGAHRCQPAPPHRRPLTINFVEAGRVAELRQLESFLESSVQEMPVHVEEMLGAVQNVTTGSP